MVSAKFIGALALLSLGAVDASVCKPSPSSVASSSIGTTSTLQSSDTESSFTETTSTAEPSLPTSDVSSSAEDVTPTRDLSTTLTTFISTSTTFNDVSSTTEVTSKTIESTTTSEGKTTIVAPDTTTTSDEVTTSSPATSTAAPPPTPTFRLYTYDSQDPALNGGIGYCKLEEYQTLLYMKFTPTSAFAPTFMIDPTMGAVTLVSGPSGSPGEVIVSTTIGGVFASSYLQIMSGGLIDTSAQELVSCSVAQDQFNKLVCDWAGGGIADFWTCGGRWMLVRPGYTPPCSSTPYKISIHAQFV
ncbi:CMGC kinase [Fusarium sp. NRRL 52700]|nr:CMGC kinase [Fusarium sp. NRRL 52700]